MSGDMGVTPALHVISGASDTKITSRASHDIQCQGNFYTLQGEGLRAGRPAVFADSQVAISGLVEKRIGAAQFASFATQILLAQMALWAASFQHRKNLQK